MADVFRREWLGGWPPAQRVRCVDASGFNGAPLVHGAEYTVRRDVNRFIMLNEIPDYRFFATRFKPVVRVKMGRAVV